MIKCTIHILILSLATLTACTSSKQLTVQNSVMANRTDELVVIRRDLLERKLGVSIENKNIQLKSRKEMLYVQHVDLDGDGKWDEANMLLSFLPKEKKKFSISVIETKELDVAVRAHVRHRRKNADNTFGPLLFKDSIPAGQPATDFTKSPLPPFLTEGPAWENDKVGFRIYFDVRNAKDIWGKKTSKMMMDTIGVIPSQNYHQEAAWGMDVLKVGASLGAGSLALSVPYKGKDSLIRLGGINMAKVVAEVVADGPLVGIIRLSYPEWKALPDLPAVRLTEEIKIWGGKYFYESNITVSNTPPGSRLVTGIVNLKSKTSSMLTSDNTKVLYTYDKQSENNDNLGMAIMIHDNNYKERGTTSNTTGDIRNTFTVTLVNLQQSSFRFYGAWSKSDVRFSTESDFRGFLQQESLSYSSPIIIK